MSVKSRLTSKLALISLLVFGAASANADKEFQPRNYRDYQLQTYIDERRSNNVAQPITKPRPSRSRPGAVTPFIIGGDNASFEEWPYIVALYQNGGTPASGQFCGGSLIRPDVVMTAAHCVFGASPSDFKVYTGSASLSTPSGTSEFLTVARIQIHEGYNPNITDNDIALVYLEQASSQPIVPLIDDPTFSSLSFGSALKVAGWGVVNIDTFEGTDLLQDVDVNYIDTQICSDAYTPIFGEGAITETMMCAGTSAGDQDACFGDSGGPLVLNTDGSPKQVGIVSFGNGSCAEQGFYGVYTKVAHFLPWINAKLEGLIAASPVSDPVLQACINNQAEATGITKIDELIELNCFGSDISDLNGLEFFYNLQLLNVGQTNVTNLEPLSLLSNLVDLDISFTQVLDLLPLAALSTLQTIHVQGLQQPCFDPSLETLTHAELVESCFTPIQQIGFADPALQQCVLDEAAFNNFSVSEQFKTLFCPGRGIINIGGIFQLNNVEEIYLDSNNIADINEIGELSKLRVGIFAFNQFSDISSFTSLENLEVLAIWSNSVSDLSPIREHTKMFFLDFESNQVSDISPLENLTGLNTIFMGDNPITCFNPPFAPISYSDIPLNCFDEFTPPQLHPLADFVFDPALKQCVSDQANFNDWQNLEDVTAISCAFSNVSDLSGVSNFFNLTELDVYGNNIFDLGPVATLDGLSVLIVGQNQIFNISPLQNLQNLFLLVLEFNPISDISPLEGLTNLEQIYLGGLDQVTCINGTNGPVDYETLESACFAPPEPFDSQVTDFNLDACIQNNLAGQQTPQDFFQLDCGGYGIISLDGLENYTNLQVLILPNNIISDLSPIAELSQLFFLDAINNNISDLSPLEFATNLDILLLGGNPLECADPNTIFSHNDIPTSCFEPVIPVGQDTDGDGIEDAFDNCPNKKNANQKDTDKDGIGNRCDDDDDNDGFTDAEENRVGSEPRNPNSTPETILFDADSDGIFDLVDNCPTVKNANQKDFDLDGLGNPCDPDDDNDGYTDAQENNAGSNSKDPNSTPSSVLIDWDNDGIHDIEDNCMMVPNANQKDFDRDGLGNACDNDDDNDGYTDAEENNAGSQPKNANSTPETILFDADSDTIPDSWDNCINKANPNQKDFDQDGLGNACDPDDDNDGFSDIEENLAGTNPKAASSFPVL